MGEVTYDKSKGRVIFMKRISLCFFLFLMFYNVGFAEECIKGDCINGQGTAKLKYKSCVTCEIEYVGEWKDGYQHGQGVMTRWDGLKYVGEWRNGSKHGKGVETYKNGSKYVGDFSGGYPEGIGTGTYENGDKYEGEWWGGNRHGQGTLTKADGKIIQGNWNNGSFFEKPKIVKKEVVNQQGLQETFLSKSKEINVLGYLNFRKESKRYIEMFPLQLDSKRIKLDLKLYPWSSKYNIKEHFDSEVQRTKYNILDKKKFYQEQFYELFLIQMHKAAYDLGDTSDALVPHNTSAHAHTILGLLYKNGELVDQNFERAFKLFEFAAGKRSAIAMYNLGMMYKKGQFVEQDNEIAFMWLDIAYREGKFPSGYDLKNEDRENMKVALLEIVPLLTQEQERNVMDIIKDCKKNKFTKCLRQSDLHFTNEKVVKKQLMRKAYENGDKYFGEWKDGQRNGKGTLIYGSGDFKGDEYYGEFKDNKIYGQGTYIYANGNVYVGEFIDNSFNGQGTFTMKNLDQYQGEWKNQKQHGQGFLDLADGRSFQGVFKDGKLIEKQENSGVIRQVNKQIVRSNGVPLPNYYIGEWKDGQKHGQGTLTKSAGSQLEVSYQGEWKDNLMHGQGIYTYSDGRTYEGQWMFGKRHGRGIFMMGNGKKYVGEYWKGKENGQGTLTQSDGRVFSGTFKDGKALVVKEENTEQSTEENKEVNKEFPNGEKYIGEWRNGKKNGHGTYIWTNKTKYVGGWKNSFYHGQGTFTWADGRKYVGRYQDGFYHEYGTFTWADGRKYDGKWKDNLFHGQGTYTYTDGRTVRGIFREGKLIEKQKEEVVKKEVNNLVKLVFSNGKYVGEVKDDKANGHGTRRWANGSKYEGEWKDNLFHGQGIHISYDNPERFLSKYEGEWKNGQRHGQGTVTMKNVNKYKYIGEWKDNAPHGQGTWMYADGKIIQGIFKDGVLIEEQSFDLLEK